MKTLEYMKKDHLQLEPRLHEWRDELYAQVEPTLARKYGTVNKSHLKKELLLVLIALHNMNIYDVSDTTFLDLGCGSVNSPDNSESVFAPWLCRCLHELGGKVIGMDNASNTNEEFTGIHADLSTVDLVQELGESSVDVATSFMLVDSPTLNGYSPSGGGYNSRNGLQLMKRLKDPLERVVKDHGVFVLYY